MPTQSLTNRRLLVWIIVCLFITPDCKNTRREKALFVPLSSDHTGIHFINAVEETDSTKSFINEFGYMGGGVGIGDFNNDGLKDIFFTGNQVSCKMYINKGNTRFEDVTETAGLTTGIWTTGISIADVNNDGYDDLYICSYGKDLLHSAKNLLFINQHNLTFKEQAQEYGLADTGYSSQAVFFDYDKDGDLDMYLANYMLNGPNANTIFSKDLSGRSVANDKLYKNDGDPVQRGHPVFTDVTLQANIKEGGFGLGVVVSDFNNDNWPDVYVANDFISNDLLWLNNKDGTFSNCISTSIQHQSYSSMGADAADINNDLLPDITTLDMLPEDNERKKTSSSFMNYDRYETERSLGYEPEFARNMLQLNNGIYTVGKTAIPFFSEIGQMAGVAATDWSWSVLTADFNNDGWKDMHITNGIGRDFINADFLEYSNTVFSTGGSEKDKRKMIRDKLIALKHIKLPNYLYLNNHDYTFLDASKGSGIDEPSMSNGAAYADLDNDGDLDLVVSNINREAFVFSNNTITNKNYVNNHYVAFSLKGDAANIKGYGCKVYVYAGGQMQMQEQNPVRGYFSTVDQKLVFGLGTSQRADSIVVQWPNNKTEFIRQTKGDTVYLLTEANAVYEKTPAVSGAAPETIFEDVTAASTILYKHVDNPYNEFNFQRLLLQKYSQSGPFITTGDINNDGLTDFFVGGAFNFSGKFFIQQPNGTFTPRNLTDSVKMQEDMDCTLFDADKDGDLDLLITSGDTRYEENAEYYQPRYYANDGKGGYSLQMGAIPSDVRTIAGCVTTGDYDGDGDLDVFIGGRVSKNYPLSPRSFILRNDRGVFTDVTGQVCPALQNPGMTTSAAWTDFDNDKQPDLIIAGDWMPVRFFKSNSGKLSEVTDLTGLKQITGMWRSLTVADIDGDGDPDVIAGNLGANCIYHVNSDNPMHLFAADIDGNSSIDPVVFYYIKNKDGNRQLAPAISRGQFAEQVPLIKKKFLYHKDYARATFVDIYDARAKEKMVTLTCDETRSCFFENTGNGKFTKHILPQEAQFAPVNAIICDDLDGDNIPDLLLAGNEYQADVITGRYDASYGCFLKGRTNKKFTYVPPSRSGFIVRGDVKDMAMLKTAKQKLIITAVNNDSMRVVKLKL
ncbi:RNA-binding protein [Segetibacter sp. 3557_3]|uniref:VCBS repeat-containing protein n=1 Tax=Segetibacter sp. 3557_3 TaxID=2547429 RepID=UPI001058FE02|nr:VCBS repeat-containing protein [Segetibacter sp. 3557_3]TDH23492.1 RNA-binding protein [Segetibacter sp. 3557_3]